MSTKSVRQGFFCDMSSLSTNPLLPTAIVPFGLGTGTKFNITEKPIKDDRERELPDKTNFKVETLSRHNTYRDLAWIHLRYFVNEGVDCQVVCEKESQTTYGGVYNFSGNNSMGFDYESLFSTKERSLKLMGEISVDVEDALRLEQNALINVPYNLTEGYGPRGENAYEHSRLGTIQNPTGTVLVAGYQIEERKLLIKSISKKLDYDRSELNWINVLFELTTQKAKALNILEHYNSLRSAPLYIEEGNADGSTIKFNFGAGVFFRCQDVTIDKDNRNRKLRFNANVCVHDVVFNDATQTISVSEDL